uniref:Ubiquitin carboxyl-terminal hydrolase 26 n=1 Tax=Anthurium amnicola TaxID=1678845 RepID=A0A1D1YFM5_9ARAE
MSRQTTRSKNKRHRADDGDDTSSEILRRIHLTGVVTPNDICQLYLINKPVCQGCRVNSRESPNCFCGLIPPSSGARKSGLWQKLSDLTYSLLGADPCEDRRDPSERPAGLTNVGATCYANSILQCLYMNTLFRDGIFSVEPDLLKQHLVLDQLAHLFAQLHSSKKAVIDLAPFVKTLELDKSAQQDSHEFLTLFLSLLEHSLSHSKVPKARTLIQDLFRGSVSHVTRCSTCGKDSEASSKMEDFYGLELNIKGLNNLEESLDDYFSIEQLFGENQYFCQSCGKRVDATRCIKLHALPTVLIFQLKRYDFLMETTKKKKITSSFSFPREMNMGRRLGDATESELLYDLSAILIHKGVGANSGHYVARIKDEDSRQWWEFDDEVVSKLGPQPFGDTPSNSSAYAQPTLKPEEVQSLSNGNHITSSQKQQSDLRNSQQQEIFSPTDAYMLIYNRISAKKEGKGSENAFAADDENVDAKLISGNVTTLPCHLFEEIEKLNAPFAQDCHEYQLKKDRQVSFITERRKEVKTILSVAPVHSPEDPFFWVSTDWLRQWADSINPPCLDNCTIQCLHGKVAVDKVSCMKRISTAAWSNLFSKYGGGPALSSDDNCIECLKGEAGNSVSAYDYRGRRASVKQIAESALAGHCPDGTSYYVSKTWLVQWLRRKNVDSPCDADAGPTASLRCPHGGLLPEQFPGAKRVQVPESLWLFLFESANVVKPDDPLGSLTFCSDSQPCEDCCRELSESACVEGSLREAKLRQRQSHEKLFSGKNVTLYPGNKYFLVPSSWLTTWRAYVTTIGKNISSSVMPESLDVIVDSLKCEKHARLLERPLGLVCKRGLITQKLSNADGLTMIPENDWKLFCEEWEVAEEKGISSEIVLSKSIASKLAGSCKEMPMLEEDLNPLNEEVVSELEVKDLIIKTDPEICEDCIGERESCELMRRLNYCNEEICVHFIRGKEVPKSLLEASASISEPDRRTSKRSRRSASGKICNLKVSGTTSVYQLKMMIWEYFGVVKENQKLHKGSIEIEGDSATLADKNIFPGDVLWVCDSEIHENRDIADELSEQRVEPHAEEGFRGTLLTSDVSIQVLKENQKLLQGSIEIEGDSTTVADKCITDSEIHENRDIDEQKVEPQSREGFYGTLLTSDVSSQEGHGPAISSQL